MGEPRTALAKRKPDLINWRQTYNTAIEMVKKVIASKPAKGRWRFRLDLPDLDDRVTVERRGKKLEFWTGGENDMGDLFDSFEGALKSIIDCDVAAAPLENEARFTRKQLEDRARKRVAIALLEAVANKKWVRASRAP